MFQCSFALCAKAALNITAHYSPLPPATGYGFQRGLKVTPFGATTLRSSFRSVLSLSSKRVNRATVPIALPGRSPQAQGRDIVPLPAKADRLPTTPDGVSDRTAAVTGCTADRLTPTGFFHHSVFAIFHVIFPVHFIDDAISFVITFQFNDFVEQIRDFFVLLSNGNTHWYNYND